MFFQFKKTNPQRTLATHLPVGQMPSATMERAHVRLTTLETLTLAVDQSAQWTRTVLVTEPAATNAVTTHALGRVVLVLHAMWSIISQPVSAPLAPRVTHSSLVEKSNNLVSNQHSLTLISQMNRFIILYTNTKKEAIVSLKMIKTLNNYRWFFWISISIYSSEFIVGAYNLSDLYIYSIRILLKNVLFCCYNSYFYFFETMDMYYTYIPSI